MEENNNRTHELLVEQANSKIVELLLEIKNDLRTTAQWVMFLGVIVLIQILILFYVIYILFA